jgi:hypothetical protein
MRWVTLWAVLAAPVAWIVLTAPGVGESTATSAPVPLNGEIPSGYRDWKLVSVAREDGSLNDLRAILANDAAIAAFRKGAPQLPDGAIIARLAWRSVPLAESKQAFGRPQSFVAGPPTNLQFMVKDADKYAATGGWGFVQFDNGKFAAQAKPADCFSCHALARTRDFVFNRYAP